MLQIPRPSKYVPPSMRKRLEQGEESEPTDAAKDSIQEKVKDMDIGVSHPKMAWHGGRQDFCGILLGEY
jgi:hypothetical protein